MHDYHNAHPGYSDNQVLHDGCAECKASFRCSSYGLSRWLLTVTVT